MLRKIKQAAVIGSGVMGGGIAALLAGAGIKTILLDVVPFDLPDKEQADPAVRNRIVKAGLDTALMAHPPLFMQFKDVERVTIGNLEDDFYRLADCDWIIEAVVENLAIKRDLFKRIEPVRQKGSIVSSNTSGLPLKKMSAGRDREFRQHFLGTHFFNPVRYMRLLELIPGEETLPDLLEFIADFGERVLGKGIVWAKDTPNFVSNRIGVQGMVNAMQLMLADGLTIPEVDALFGPVMGRPKTAMFKTADLVGLDVLKSVAQNTFDLVVDDEARDSFAVPDCIDRMIAENLLGKKTGSGFYKTDRDPEGQKIRKVIDPQTLEYAAYDPPGFPCLAQAQKAKTLPEKMKAVVYGQDKGALFAWKVVAHGLIYAANRIPEIADTVIEIDKAVRWGFNFEMGPFETWDAIGIEHSVAQMEKDGLAVPAKVKQMVASGHRSFYKTRDGKRFFYDFISQQYQPVVESADIISLDSLKHADKVVKTGRSASLVDLGDGVFCLEFHSKMNILNSEIIELLLESVDYVDSNGVGLVIGNQAGGVPGVFSAGGDLYSLAALAREGKYAQIGAFLQNAQNAFQKTRYSPLPVVAAPYGMALGGGCEVCLAADRIVAHVELYMGLVEIGVGLLPAAGGCLNLWKKVVNTIPPVVTDVDLSKFFVPVFMSIAMAKVSTSAADARANGFLGPWDRIVFNRDYLIAEAKKEVLKTVDEGYVPPVKRKIKVLGEAAQGMISAEIFNMLQGRFITEYDAFLAQRIAYVISGGDVRNHSEIEEDVILKLEREAFVDF